MKRILFMVAIAAFVFACGNAPQQEETCASAAKECCKTEGKTCTKKEGEGCCKEKEEGKKECSGTCGGGGGCSNRNQQ